ncbi:hypothetical protein NECAME_02596 [Necator americanus]|uniref:Uncharacterized protein n=1 Tax=Necator americanus TaxID=51031 RepID=W2TD05_NECAM|nr:hypothetical protein NECAME_02596 [Necator americanus]ETN79479.1 hypothetical protein NECAME_02596 [Necator americanus]
MIAATFNLKAVVDYILNGRHFSNPVNIFDSERPMERDECKMIFDVSDFSLFPDVNIRIGRRDSSRMKKILSSSMME